MIKKLITILILSAPIFAQPANAAIAYAYGVPTAGNQTFTGVLGLDFNVNSTIQISHLLAFDDDADGWTAGTAVAIAIYDRTTQAAVTPYLSFTPSQAGDLVVGSYRSIALATPVILPAGGQYSVVAQSFNANDLLQNAGVAGGIAPTTDNGGGLITFTGLGRNDIFLNQFPNRIDLGPANRYGAGSFIFEAASVPEPSAACLVVFGVLTTIMQRRRARQE
jgi:hypothetical protein